MLISFGGGGSPGGASGLASYLTGIEDSHGQEREEVRVLAGDPFSVAKVADSLDFKNTYTHGIIAWHPGDQPTREEMQSALEEFTETAFPGMDPSRYSFAAVLHDGHSPHIHFMAARVDLETGKSLNIAPPGWEKTFDPLADALNYEHGWSRPADIELKKAISRPAHEHYQDAAAMRNISTQTQGLKDSELSQTQQTKAFREVIGDYAQSLVMSGSAYDRDGIKAGLESAGMEVTRAGKDYITVSDPESGLKARMKGELFKQDFKAEEWINEQNNRDKQAAEQQPGELSERVGRVDPVLAGKARERLAERVTARREYFENRYPSNDRRMEPEVYRSHDEGYRTAQGSDLSRNGGSEVAFESDNGPYANRDQEAEKSPGRDERAIGRVPGQLHQENVDASLADTGERSGLGFHLNLPTGPTDRPGMAAKPTPLKEFFATKYDELKTTFGDYYDSARASFDRARESVIDRFRALSDREGEREAVFQGLDREAERNNQAAWRDLERERGADKEKYGDYQIGSDRNQEREEEASFGIQELGDELRGKLSKSSVELIENFKEIKGGIKVIEEIKQQKRYDNGMEM